MKLEKRKYQIMGVTPILGSQPSSKEVRTQFIASKIAEVKDDEDEMIPEDIDTKGLSVFYVDPVHGNHVMLDYQLKGFLKGAGSTLAKQLNLAAVTGKIDRLVFVTPRMIPLVDDDGNPIMDVTQYERPLRAETMRGPRVALASSEMIQPPWNLFFEITLLDNEGTAKSKPITFEVIEELLDYGALQGLGQFRNGSFGQFDWQRIS